MKKILYFMIFLLVVSTAFASEMTIVSDTDTEYHDGTGWVPAVAAWVHPAWTSNVNVPGAVWVWTSYQVSQEEAVDGSEYTFRRSFELPKCAENIKASMQITTDNEYAANFPHIVFGADDTWTSVENYDISSFVQPGLNTFQINAVNAALSSGTPETNPGGLIYRVDISYDGCETPDVPEFSGLATAGLLSLAVMFVVFKRR